MKIYLDTCSLQRPLDTKSQPRIIIEAEAVLAILALCEAGLLELVASGALLFETERNPHPVRKEYALEILVKARSYVGIDEHVERRARVFLGTGIEPLDALHLASAIEAEADFFCTCDGKLLRRARGLQTGKTKVVSPVELITEVDT